MWKWIIAGSVSIIAAALWWLLLADSKAPAQAPGVFDIAQWHQLTAGDDPQTYPVALHWHEIGRDAAPGFAIKAGAFRSKLAMSYHAIQIAAPDASIMIDAAIDEETAISMETTKRAWAFDSNAYDALLAAMAQADKVIITHEHPDHIMGIARHPAPAALAPRLWLNAPQIAALPRFINGTVPPPYQSLPARLDGKIHKLAPGVIIIPAPGHTPGSQLVFITVQNGTQYLLVGDIAWNMININGLTTRPILTQFLVFDPDEDRTAVKQQLRALYDLQKSHPEIIIIPAHDRDRIMALVAEGKIEVGLAQ